MFSLEQLPRKLRERIRIVGECWIWTGYIFHCGTRQGYGKVTFNHKSWLTHRLVYTLLVENIPSRLVLDHLIECGICMDTRCCNPIHVEAVRQRENVIRGCSPCANNARKTHCHLGHLLAGKNLRVSKRFTRSGLVYRTLRVCRECNRLKMADFHLRHPRRKVKLANV